jgi:vacuolar-type H+-ATPase subunit F/Vma7
MRKEIAVLADPELVDALRLAGVHRVRALRAEPGAAGAVAETLRAWLVSDQVGAVVIGADHAALARDVVAEFRRGKRISPVIVEVPSRDGAWATDATEYYQQLGRAYLGLEIVLQGTEASTDEATAGTG